MKATTLLRELAPLTHDARVRRMAALGREARTDAAIAVTLTTLEQGDVYQRSLALYACYGSGDGALVLRGITDPSRSVRGLAYSLLALACDDAQVQAALSTVSVRAQRVLLRRLAARRRFAPVDAFLATLPAEQVGPLLAYASPGFAAAHAEAALADAGATEWSRFARRYPHLAAANLLRRAEGATDLDQRLRRLANAAIPHLARAAPDDALALVQRLQPYLPLNSLHLGVLPRRRPNAMADLLIASNESNFTDFSVLARRLDTEQLQGLVARGRLGEPGDWLSTLAPALRAELYRRNGEGWRDFDGSLALAIALALPDPLRSAEARRHLTLPAFQSRPVIWFRYASGLPWDEARAALTPFLRHPDPELRSVALPALIGAARYQREHLPAALQLVLDRRNEQDPVRLAMLHALADLPPARWNTEQLPGLGQALRDALDAADCSPATAAQVQRLVIALLPFHPAWAAEWLATLGRERGTLSSTSLEQRLSPRDVERIAPALLPVLEAWEPREREQALFQVAALFGRRLNDFPALVAILERLTRDHRGWVAGQALTLIARFSRDRLPTLIPELLREDPSWVTQPIVYSYLHRHRQDLITPFLKPATHRGRFATGKTHFVLPLLTGFQRWTPVQQRAFARVLEQITRDEQRDNPARFQAIYQLAALPAVAPTRIVELAAVDNPRPALREVALRALGRLDGGEGIPELIAALEDERARIAVYALRRALLEMPPQQARTLLRSIPLQRVSVAKEAVRLLGELPESVVYADLLALAGEELHRDVRVALLRAFWNHLERAETWPILETAARDTDTALISGMIRMPAERLSAEGQRRLISLLTTLLTHPDASIRVTALNRCATLPITDADRQLQAPLLAALGSELADERWAAARAVLKTYVGRQASIIGATVTALKNNARALLSIVESLQMHMSSPGLQPTLHAVIQALADDPRTASWQVQLAAGGLDWPDALEVLRRLAASGELHAEATMAASYTIEQRWLSVDADGLAPFEAALRTETDSHLRRIGLSALISCARWPRGWTAERRRLLAQYRADPAPLVAAAAWCTFPDTGDDT